MACVCMSRPWEAKINASMELTTQLVIYLFSERCCLTKQGIE